MFARSGMDKCVRSVLIVCLAVCARRSLDLFMPLDVGTLEAAPVWLMGWAALLPLASNVAVVLFPSSPWVTRELRGTAVAAALLASLCFVGLDFLCSVRPGAADWEGWGLAYSFRDVYLPAAAGNAVAAQMAWAARPGGERLLPQGPAGN